MNTGSEAIQKRVQPPDAEHWQASLTAFRDYLAGCRAWLEQYPKLTSTTEAAPVKSGKGLGLPRDAANHRSEHVYLLPAGSERVTLPYEPVTTGYRPSIWTVLGDEIDGKRKRKAA